MSDDAAVELLRGQIARMQTIAGWKVALNFPGPQKLLGLTHSLAAPLERLHAFDSGSRIEVADDRRIHVEAEVALRLGHDVQSTDIDHLRTCVAGYTPCLELVDYALPRNGLPAMFAHAFFHAGIVQGSEHTEPPEAAYPRARNSAGKTHARLPGTVPDDVLEALAGLCERVREAGGELRRGQLVLCGSYIEPLALETGSTVEVDFGPALGTLSVSR